MRQSKSTWKRVERRTAADLGGRRNGNTGAATADVDAGLFCVECKSWRRPAERIEAALRQAEAARRPGQIAIARIHTVGKHNSQDLAVMRWSDFLDLHGDGKATVSDLVQDLIDKANVGDAEARRWLAVLAPDKLPTAG
jgi:hypothetical protein